MNITAQHLSPASRDFPYLGVSSRRTARTRFSLLAAFVFISILCFALGWWYRRYPYRATAFVQVNRETPWESSGLDYEVFRETQLALIKSSLVINSVLSRDNIAQLDCVAMRQSPEVWLQRELHVEFPGRGEIMQISLSGREAEMPDYCLLVDALIDSYSVEILHKERVDRQAVEELRRSEADRIRAELKQKLDQLNELTKSLGDVDAASSSEAVLLRTDIESLCDTWSELQSDLHKSRIDEKLQQTRMRVLQRATAAPIE